jgi:hypothetical protein
MVSRGGRPTSGKGAASRAAEGAEKFDIEKPDCLEEKETD